MTDRLKYFRIEASELVERMQAELLAFERGEGSVEPILRSAHTLKGAARVVGQSAVADAAHALEERLDPRGGDGATPAERLAQALGLLDAIASLVDGLTSPRLPSAPSTPQHEESIETVRVEVAAMDALMEDLAEAAQQIAGLRQHLDRLAALSPLAASLAAELSAPQAGRALAVAEELADAMERVKRAMQGTVERAADDVAEARERAHALRLVPVQQVFTQLERAVRDAAHTRDTAVVFEATGGETRLDGPVLLQVRDALLHLVRNAVAHGIEAPAARRLAGKPAAGRVRLHAERHGDRVVFTCDDDGGGLDARAIREAARQRGFLAPEAPAALSDEQIRALIFRAGLSTEPTVTELAGRGVGLDVVRAIAARLKGTLSVSSEAGRGTAFTLNVPLSVSALTALLVEAGGRVGALPLAAVARTSRVSATAVATVGGRRTVVIDDRELPFLALSAALGQGERTEPTGAWTIVHVRSGTQEAALGVNRLLGTSELIVRPIPALAGALPFLSGASFDAEGVPLPVFDPAGLVAAAQRAGGSRPAPAPAKPILVVDDSLTTRMLEQSILEAAGYGVVLAASGEDALRLAREHAFGLFIVDVEMPGMSGFEFVEATRRDAALARTPAMLVTSRQGASDRRKGAEVGAQAYLIKSEFNQDRFLETVRRLVV